MYDIDKIAIYEDDEINFYSILEDSLLKESSIALEEGNLQNFSMSSSLEFIVYQTRNKIILKNISSGEEEELFRNKHQRK